MKLAEVKNGDTIFVDANIFIYSFAGKSHQCKELLLRCARKQIAGYTSVTTVAEVAHRLMVAEAIEKEYVEVRNAVSRLRENPSIVKSLKEYNKNIKAMFLMNTTIFTLTDNVLMQSMKVREETGLLVNDSLTVAFMRAHGLMNLASSDSDFAKVKGISLYSPTDL